MSRHKLTKKERIRGRKKAARSRKTPPQLRKALKKQLKKEGE